jgi:transposase
MLRAIAAAKKKNDRIDANKICDCLRCDFLPECYMAPTAIRERRRTLRYRNLLVRQMVQRKAAPREKVTQEAFDRLRQFQENAFRTAKRIRPFQCHQQNRGQENWIVHLISWFPG